MNSLPTPEDVAKVVGIAEGLIVIGALLMLYHDRVLNRSHDGHDPEPISFLDDWRPPLVDLLRNIGYLVMCAGGVMMLLMGILV